MERVRRNVLVNKEINCKKIEPVLPIFTMITIYLHNLG